MSTTTPPFPANRAGALRRVYDTIAALDLAGRSESGLSGKEADEQRDNLGQAVRLLLSGAHADSLSRSGNAQRAGGLRARSAGESNNGRGQLMRAAHDPAVRLRKPSLK